MKKNFSLLLTLFIFLSPQISMTTEVQGYIPFTMENLNPLAKDFINGLSENKNMALFCALFAAILGVVIYNKYINGANSPNTNKDKTLEPTLKLTPQIQELLKKQNDGENQQPSVSQTLSTPDNPTLKKELFEENKETVVTEVTTEDLKILVKAYPQKKTQTNHETALSSQMPQQIQQTQHKWYQVKLQNNYPISIAYKVIKYTDNVEQLRANSKGTIKLTSKEVDILGYASLNKDNKVIIQRVKSDPNSLLTGLLVRASGAGSEKGLRNFTDLRSPWDGLMGQLTYNLIEYKENRAKEPTEAKLILQPTTESGGIWQWLPTTSFEGYAAIESEKPLLLS